MNTYLIIEGVCNRTTSSLPNSPENTALYSMLVMSDTAIFELKQIFKSLLLDLVAQHVVLPPWSCGYLWCRTTHQSLS